jgi:hypothetical protein
LAALLVKCSNSKFLLKVGGFKYRIVVREIDVRALLFGRKPFEALVRERRFRALVLQNHSKNIRLFTKGIRQIRHNVRCMNFNARRRIRYIRANEARASNNALMRQKCPRKKLCIFFDYSKIRKICNRIFLTLISVDSFIVDK